MTAEERAEAKGAAVTRVKVERDRAAATVRFPAPEPGVASDVFSVRLRKLNGDWLISDLDPSGVAAEVERGFERAERSRRTAEDLDCSRFRFRGKVWRRDAADFGDRTPTQRQRLADGIIKCRTLSGLPQPQLRRMLGQPDNYVAHTSGEWSWTTGPERNYISVDHEHLLVRFDSKKKVRSVELVTD